MKIISGTGHFVSSYGESFLTIDGTEYSLSGIVGDEMEKLEEEYDLAFSCKGGIAGHGFPVEEKREYAEEKGRAHPRAYRIRIVVSAEEMCKEDAERYWFEKSR